jgi:hypothetical protein
MKYIEATKNDMTRYIVRYDEFYYKASKWDYPRRVVVKAEKPFNQLNLRRKKHKIKHKFQLHKKSRNL